MSLPVAEIVLRWLPLWLCLLVLPAILGCAVALYSRDRQLVSRRRGWLLTLLRLLLLFFLVTVLVDPAIVSTSVSREPGRVLVVVDASPSMALQDPDRPASQKRNEARALERLGKDELGAETGAPRSLDGLSRLGLARRALAGDFLDELARRHRLALYRLGSELTPIHVDGESLPAVRDALRSLEAGGGLTDLSVPLVAEAARWQRGSISGVFLFSDGNHHASGNPRRAARALSALQVPIVAVGVGAQAKPPDIALADVDATGKFFSRDEVEVEIAVTATGLGAVSLPLTIRDGARVVAQRSLSIPDASGTLRFPLRFPAGEPGRKKLSASFPPVSGEVTAANNRRSFWIEVLESKARLLYVEGSPRWEYRRLKNTWQRDPYVELDTFLVTPPPDRRLPADWPREREALFGYDALILGDVEPDVFSQEELVSLRDFVTARGGTVIFLAGERAMPSAWQDTPLANLIPVELLSPTPPPELGAELARAGPSYSLTPEGETSSLVRLVPGRQSTVELWSVLPVPNWFAPVGVVKPGGTALVELVVEAGDQLLALPGRASKAPNEGEDARQRRIPLLVTRPSGAGKVLYSGMDSTWKWRRGAGDTLYQRFWDQAVRWAVSERLGGSDGHVRLGTDRLVYEHPLRVEIEALVHEAPDRPLDGGVVEAVVTAKRSSRDTPSPPQGAAAPSWRRRVPLEFVPQSDGRYQGVLEDNTLATWARSSHTGSELVIECSVVLEIADLPTYNERQDRTEVSFLVELPADPEALDFTCNAALLEDLAELSGGVYLPMAQYREALEHLPDRSRVVRTRNATGPLDFPLLVTAVAISLVALEWILRKWWNLL